MSNVLELHETGACLCRRPDSPEGGIRWDYPQQTSGAFLTDLKSRPPSERAFLRKLLVARSRMERRHISP